MSTLIKVHMESGREFYINADQIVWMERSHLITKVFTRDGSTLYLQEAPASIAGAVLVLERGKAASAAEAGK